MQRSDLDGLIAFLKVAERRSFTAAARDLGVTPSAISQTVRMLEERAGVALLARTTRDVALTEAGRRFLERARPAVDNIRAAFWDAASLGDRPSGLLRLNVPRVSLSILILDEGAGRPLGDDGVRNGHERRRVMRRQTWRQIYRVHEAISRDC